jgi:hypothetical protein
MRYMLLIYSKEQETSAETLRVCAETHATIMDETSRRGILVGASPLEPTGTATTVRVRNGHPLVSDGPFAETKEQLAGYYILDCRDLDEAIEWASRIPTDCFGGEGCIEIRPLRVISANGAAALAPGFLANAR